MTYPWGSNRRFNSRADHCRRQYGSRLQKVSIDAGFTCPNRDGNKGKGGCSFCSNDAFNPSYCTPEKSITQQINEGIDFHRKRYRQAVKYIAYFQPYSNTYAPLEKLKTIYGEALNHPYISGISIGTRPDCVDEKILDYLQELSVKYFVSLELGIESCYDKTLLRVNRCHDFEQSRQVLKMAAVRKIPTTAHFILGLPGETRNEILEQSTIINTLPLLSIKFHQLQILKGTRMAKDYFKTLPDFHLLSLDEYIDLIIDMLERLRPDLQIERLCGEVPPRFLAVPAWGLIRNDEVIRRIEKRMELRDTFQGKRAVSPNP